MFHKFNVLGCPAFVHAFSYLKTFFTFTTQSITVMVMQELYSNWCVYTCVYVTLDFRVYNYLQ